MVDIDYTAIDNYNNLHDLHNQYLVFVVKTLRIYLFYQTINKCDELYLFQMYSLFFQFTLNRELLEKIN